MKMTVEELYKKADYEMTICYNSAIKILQEKKETDAKFIRDFSQGEIDGISQFTMIMYLNLFYNYDNENEEEEDSKYLNFCQKISDRKYELEKLLRTYSIK